jgi:hypothetical protein
MIKGALKIAKLLTAASNIKYFTFPQLQNLHSNNVQPTCKLHSPPSSAHTHTLLTTKKKEVLQDLVFPLLCTF